VARDGLSRKRCNLARWRASVLQDGWARRCSARKRPAPELRPRNLQCVRQAGWRSLDARTFRSLPTNRSPAVSSHEDSMASHMLSEIDNGNCI